MVPKLNLLKPNRKNHNLTPPLQDDSGLIQQPWEYLPKTLEHLFHDLIRFPSNSNFSNRSGRKASFGIANPLKNLDTTLIYNTSSLTHFLLGKLCFGSQQGRSILFRILFCHHRDSWYPCQLSKYSPSNDTESTRTHIQTNNLLTSVHNISPWFTDKNGSICFTRYYWSYYSDQMP